MSKKPLVSILIASYNKEKFVSRCIESCLFQSYKNIEIIFFDDGSTDNSYQIAKRYKKINVIKNTKKNKNSKFNTYPQLNSYVHAFKKSKGKIISFLDSDDYYQKNKIKEIVEYFKNNSNSLVVFDKPIHVFSNNKKIYPFKNINNKLKKNIWPKFPPQSCISIKKRFFKDFFQDIINKDYSMLTLDFRISILSNIVLKDFFIIDKNLTYYYQDIHGESLSKFKKFGVNWWLRRGQAHNYVKHISKKYDIRYNMNLDHLITSLLVKFIK
jgi:glycosyltransferase involved in cell wall biosynthesis